MHASNKKQATANSRTMCMKVSSKLAPKALPLCVERLVLICYLELAARYLFPADDSSSGTVQQSQVQAVRATTAACKQAGQLLLLLKSAGPVNTTSCLMVLMCKVENPHNTPCWSSQASKRVQLSQLLILIASGQSRHTLEHSQIMRQSMQHDNIPGI